MKTPPINMVYPFVVVAGEESVKLGPLQWKLLNYMLEHRGELLTPYVIYRDVWKLHPAAIRIKNAGAIASSLTRISEAVPVVLIGRVRHKGWALL